MHALTSSTHASRISLRFLARSSACHSVIPASSPLRHLPVSRGVASGLAPVLLLTAAMAGPVCAQDAGTPCVARSGSPCVIDTRGASPPPPSGKGQNGDPGGPGSAITHGFTGNYQPTQQGTTTPPIYLNASGGNGATGSGYASLEKVGGNGGNGGNGGAITVTATPAVSVNTQGMQASNSSGLPAQAAMLLYSAGGTGGVGALGGHEGGNGTGGIGGNGGAIIAGTASAPLLGSIFSTTSEINGLQVMSVGGTGGAGESYQSIDDNDDGANAGNGGSAGNVTVVLGGSAKAYGVGLMAASLGGNGGQGGKPYTSTPVGANGGNGGNGGSAGSVTVTLATGASVASLDAGAPALVAQSFGGAGGAGGGGGDASGGKAGAGSNGGTIVVTNDGQVSVQTANSPGILVQSFGGSGANGGGGGAWGSSGGSGGFGGDGGSITILGNGSVSIGYSAIPAPNSPAILAQSIGGGGGNGGDANGWLAVGGEGGVAAQGGTINIFVDNTITTYGERSNGIMAQSIGGGGGNGGNASGVGFLVDLTVGGTAGGGGGGEAVSAASAGSIQTNGLHASGLVLQSIGGGGGNGGAAYSVAVGVQASVAVAVGGSGGAGGNGGTIQEGTDPATGQSAPTNSGQIATTGADSYGILAQSIGGGGGTGGASVAAAQAYLGEDVPTIALAASLGGSGKAGGSGQLVNVVNAGLIATRGAGSAGIVAQSIGGGGGAGGDSSATATAAGGDFNIASAVSLGGNGGNGGSGGTVIVANNGMILTTGESADGILAQSIGGGGGFGGAGDGKASTNSSGDSMALSLDMGGRGGDGGGSGGAAVATNAGVILTLGDGANGMTVQTIGGGGGRGGGGAGSAKAGSGNETASFSANVTLGGNGGNGGGADQSTASGTNSGTILTFGADATGMLVQSIGGGGGDGGTAATTVAASKSTSDGGNGSAATIDARFAALAAAFIADGAGNQTAAYNSAAAMIGLANDLLGNSTVGSNSAPPVAELLNTLGSSAGDNEDSNVAGSINLGIKLGGSAGSGNNGGPVTVTTTGNSSIATVGAMSDGIEAQSVGGGGGTGGAATTSTSSGSAQVAIALGGTGGSGGNGGAVTVNNSGNVTTVGGVSAGILAQSVGGGGGEGGASGAKAGALKGVSITLGGTGGGAGSSGSVTVTNAATIETLSHDSAGIIAQSIAGGGGVVRTLSTDPQDNNGGGATKTGGAYNINLSFGGGSGTSGNSGPVSVVNMPGAEILTQGDNAFGIVAQSIAGGGGLVLGGQIAGNQSFFGSAPLFGSADTIQGVAVETAGSIITQGDGAIGILAQSIGGGGGIGGNISQTSQLQAFTPNSRINGSGGPVQVTVDPNALVQTNGANAPAIFAQSIGGGGGRVVTEAGTFNGSAGGIGYASPVTIEVDGTVRAIGTSSAGIYAQSAGMAGSGAPISITVGSGATVSGGVGTAQYGADAPGISVDTGSSSAANPNLVSNTGMITSAGGVNGMAIYSTVGNLAVTNDPTGVIVGNISLNNGGGSGSLTNDGTLLAGQTIRLGTGGTLTNDGTLDIRGDGGFTSLNGTYQGVTGASLLVSANFATGTATRLIVSGPAALDGGTMIQVDVQNWQKGSAPVLTAIGGISQAGNTIIQATNPSYLFSLQSTVANSTLQVQSVSAVSAAAANFSANQQSVANSLEQMWNVGGGSAAGAVAALATVDGPESYRTGLTSIAGASVGGVVAVKQAASDRFADNMMNCEKFGAGGTVTNEESCAWLRTTGTATSLASDSDGAGYHQTAVTYQAGGQREVAPGWFVGGSLGYETSWLTGTDDGSSVSGQSALAGVMLKHQSGPWELSSVLDGGYGWYASRRQIIVGTMSGQAAASPNVANVGVHLRAAYQVSMGAWYVKPSVTFGATYRNMSGYSESGSTPFNLDVKAGSNVTAGVSPMVEIGQGRELPGFGGVRGFVAVGAAFYANNDWTTQASFAQAPAGTAPFTATSRLPGAVGKVDAGVELFSFHNVSARLVYSAQLAPGFSAQSAIGRLTYAF
jgi:hypothetical protein